MLRTNYQHLVTPTYLYLSKSLCIFVHVANGASFDILGIVFKFTQVVLSQVAQADFVHCSNFTKVLSCSLSVLCSWLLFAEW